MATSSSESPLQYFLRSNYYTLHHYQLLVDQHRIYYDRTRCGRRHHLARHYKLHYYRKLATYETSSGHVRESISPIGAQLDYPLYLEKPILPWTLRFQKYFFLFYALRCLSVGFIKLLTDAQWKRIWIGTEFLGPRERFYIETTFFFWSSIGFLYYTFSISDCLLDYKFLALQRISPKRPEYLDPAMLGLSPSKELYLTNGFFM